MDDVRTRVVTPLGPARPCASNFPEPHSAPSMTFFGNASPVHTHRRMTLIISAASPFPVRDIMDPQQLRTLLSEPVMSSGNPGGSSSNPARNAPLISRAPSGCLPVTANTASAPAHHVMASSVAPASAGAAGRAVARSASGYRKRAARTSQTLVPPAIAHPPMTASGSPASAGVRVRM